MPEGSPITERHGRLQEAIANVVGPRHLLTDPADLAPHLTEERGRYRGRTPFLVRPGTPEETAEVVRLCAEARVPMVPQGGNTGLCGGAIPFETGDEVIVALGRLKRIRDLDAENFTITVEAGCILADLQQAAAAANRLFPLSLGAQGSCQIGGNLSTNAGGVQVLRYGNMRDLTLGLEVVLPDGRIWDGLRGLRKDNTGYDFKHLFLGAEGTLGIVTAAVLKLFARPREIVTAFVALPSPEAAVDLLGRARSATGEAVTSFELIPRLGLEMTRRRVEGCSDPLESPSPWYLLIELYGGGETGALGEALESLLSQAFEAALVTDAAIAQNAQQAADFWRLREGLVEAQKHEGGSIKHDVAVPVSKVPAFIAEATAEVQRRIPGVRPVPFGHVGDGNIHFNLSQPDGAERDAFLACSEEINEAVHDIVARFGGSFSAEHGLGRMKVAEAERLKPPIEIEMMRRLKRSFDPHNLMNPGKVVSAGHT
ncbi:FAD-binding oxidoreductase [Algihabitans albus]|uniref:FAD-binding oxidoreductase n=1 Tax=Algihabitans albus TaxID=2164067 RepID=UPI000E5D9651|nr:FAD-binding oxidoreductase [Algihabitans albus]